MDWCFVYTPGRSLLAGGLSLKVSISPRVQQDHRKTSQDCLADPAAIRLFRTLVNISSNSLCTPSPVAALASYKLKTKCEVNSDTCAIRVNMQACF